MTFARLLVVCDEEGEKFSAASPGWEKKKKNHLCCVVCVCVLRSCSPGFITKPWLRLLSPPGTSLFPSRGAPQKAVSFGKLQRARDETLRNLKGI